MVATESQDMLNRRFISDFASVVGFSNTLRALPREWRGENLVSYVGCDDSQRSSLIKSYRKGSNEIGKCSPDNATTDNPKSS